MKPPIIITKYLYTIKQFIDDLFLFISIEYLMLLKTRNILSNYKITINKYIANK